MTRETKIGLLVGLAFIIVIGILLSDHLTSTNEPQQAPLAQAGGNVRNGVLVPGGGNQPPITVAPAIPAQVAPQQPVPTKEELTPKQPPVEIVQIGGSTGATPVAPPAQAHAPAAPRAAGSQHPQPPVQIAQAKPEIARAPVAPQPPVEIAPAPTPVARTSDPSVPGSLANVARTMGEELVPASDRPEQLTSLKPYVPPVPLPPGAKRVKAESGDSLSRLASRHLGANNQANRDAIVAVNPSLQKNPDIVVVGRTYVIPPPGAAVVATIAPPAAPAATVQLAPAPAAPPIATPAAPVATSSQPAPAAPLPPVASRPEYFYTVKSGDSLTKISVEQLGNAGGVAAIKDLNQDVLKGGDIIRPNMKLRLPAKPLAAAN
ncbi:MAG TPA: LysM peptidoglycan-binding domain-containing protein [Tepidisphaeraceae bacterium]|nr:LysM peptidoglycan-binding domain-containing protein [Tepidisphaeraceae bacterium]